MSLNTDGDDLDLNSSNGSDLDATPAPETVTGEVADSSSAHGENDDDLLSIARDAIAKERAPASTASPAEGGEDRGSGEPPPADNEDYTDVPFSKHPRFRQLVRERNEYREAAGEYSKITRFLDESGLSRDEAGEALNVAALAKLDPKKAWETVRPWVQKLLIAAGEVLPDDLRQRVERGEVPQDVALEISRSNAAIANMQAAQQFRQEREAQVSRERVASEMHNASIAWAEDRKLKDPNFDAKLDSLVREVAYLQRQENGRPTTPEGVRRQLDTAYAAVNKVFKPPQPPAARPTPRLAAGDRAQGKPAAPEMSTLDIIRAHRRSA